MRTIIHMSLSIHGVLKRSDRELKRDHCRWITRDDGSHMTPTELRTALCVELAKGFDFLPMSDKCDNFDPKKGCRGHDVIEAGAA